MLPFAKLLVGAIEDGRNEKTRGAAGSLMRREAEGLRIQCCPKMTVGLYSSSLSESLSESDEAGGWVFVGLWPIS